MLPLAMRQDVCTRALTVILSTFGRCSLNRDVTFPSGRSLESDEQPKVRQQVPFASPWLMLGQLAEYTALPVEQ